MATGSNSPGNGPHRAIAVDSARDRFTLDLFDCLWSRYRQRVSYVADYERIVQQAGATFVNDHIAFRSLACQQPLTGIASVARVFEALGYSAAGCYHFPATSLSAIHFQHANTQFPKLFISECKTWELPPAIAAAVQQCVASHRPPVSDDLLRALSDINGSTDENALAELLSQATEVFHQLPWSPPQKSAVELVETSHQYAAWTMLHGYNVNHFTSLINSHGVPELDDIEKTAAALSAAGVPMKQQIEGAAGSRLRQTATHAVQIETTAKDGNQEVPLPWTYAYFELAQRGQVMDPATQQTSRFEGFLGPQANQLFDMTKR